MLHANFVYGLIIYAIGFLVLLFLSQTLLQAGRRQGTAGSNTARQIVVGLWGWAFLANIYAVNSGPEFFWLAPAIALPLIVGTALTFVPKVAHLLTEVSIARLVGVQFYRNAGAVFLLAHFGFGHYMSREFALNAGWGDVLTGMLAIPVALAAYRKIRFWQVLVIVWCLIGTADLILAPVTAQIYGAMLIDDYPLNAIPLFFGPPLGVLLHIITVRVLWLQRELMPNATSVSA